jgi:Zn-dependent M16 (insulinase) family peptidase
LVEIFCFNKKKDTRKLKEEEQTAFSRPISSLSESVTQTVYFPCDDESTANGLVALAWRGPSISNLRDLIALDLLFYYLSDSSISPLHSHFVNTKSYCNKVYIIVVIIIKLKRLVTVRVKL